MRKSETGVALPLIRTQRRSTNFSTRSPRNSLFIERVKHEVAEGTTYQEMPTQELTEEQQRLKKILRDFNDQTHVVLGNFIDGRPRKTPKRRTRSTAHQLQTSVKEIENLDKVVAQCKAELKVLQARCDNLKYLTKEQMSKQIEQTKKEIEKLRVSNKDYGREVTLNGLNICRGGKYYEVKDIEYDKAQVEAKQAHFMRNVDEQLNEIEELKKKSEEADRKMKHVESQYNECMAKEQELSGSGRLQVEQKEKKKQVQYLRGRLEGFVGSLKQKYLTRLRELDQVANRMRKLDGDLEEKDIATAKSKQELIILEHQWAAKKQSIKKGETIKLLQKQ